jgi:hypothetical protein
MPSAGSIFALTRRSGCSGGLELLFGKIKEHRVDVPADVANMRQLIRWMQLNLLTERPELFVSGDTV